MNEFVTLFKTVIHIFLEAMDICLLLRAILSWFPGEFGGIQDFIFTVTEPLVGFVRGLLDKVPFFRNFPIDLSLLVSYVIIAFLILILYFYLFFSVNYFALFLF